MDILIDIDSDNMHSLGAGSLIILACDKLSESGIKNFIHWNDEISVDIAGESHGVMIDYVAAECVF